MQLTTMRTTIFTMILTVGLWGSACLGQSKKTEQILKATEKTSVISQTLLLSDYFIVTSMNSKSFFPDPLLAGSNTIIECTGTAATGSAVIALKLNFVTDAPQYPKAEYNAANKTIYVTEPLSQLPVIIAQLEKTLDKVGDKKLKAIFLEDAAGASIFLLSMYSANAPVIEETQPADRRPLPPPAQPVKQ